MLKTRFANLKRRFANLKRRFANLRRGFAKLKRRFAQGGDRLDLFKKRSDNGGTHSAMPGGDSDL